jgi:hypothetical protein
MTTNDSRDEGIPQPKGEAIARRDRALEIAGEIVTKKMDDNLRLWLENQDLKTEIVLWKCGIGVVLFFQVIQFIWKR